MSTADDQNRQIFDEFRANGGKVGGHFAGSTLLLLTTTGSKSGRQTISPVICTVDGDRILIYAAAAGRPNNPAWYHNVVAHPDVTVEFGIETFPARATAGLPASASAPAPRRPCRRRSTASGTRPARPRPACLPRRSRRSTTCCAACWPTSSP